LFSTFSSLPAQALAAGFAFLPRASARYVGRQMLQGVALLTALVAIVAAFVLYFSAPRLAGSVAGKLALLFGIVLLPLLAVVGGTGYAYDASSSTEFCVSCHEMEPHGRSLFVDDRRVLPAVHYQRRLVDRDHACFQCHTDYAMFGDLAAKANGLKHVWVHYFGDNEGPFELYAPYPNHNCLHCHDDARGYLEAAPHAGQFEELRGNRVSCLKCHNAGHAHEQVREQNFWMPE
jgi:nitrate/TMAO reductase-like tetraheme cytochrome c subunit